MNKRHVIVGMFVGGLIAALVMMYSASAATLIWFDKLDVLFVYHGIALVFMTISAIGFLGIVLKWGVVSDVKSTG